MVALWALAAVLLLMSREFTNTPGLDGEAKEAPMADAVAELADSAVDAIVGAGLSFLGLACSLVFVAALARAIGVRTGRPSLRF